jgi:hypothetical protein
LTPREARELHQDERNRSIEALFRDAIGEKDDSEIEKWDKLRKIPFRKTKLSN